jgi:AcrR family transcriptional regulator
MPVETREKILAAVETLLDRDPGLSFSLDSIAKLAGVSKGGLLYHFKTKESVLLGLVDRFVSRFDSALESMIVENKIGYSKAYVEASLQPGAVKAMRVIIGVACVDEKLLYALKNAYRRWQRELAQDLGDETSALNLRLTIDGFLLASLGGLEAPSSKEMNLVLRSIDASVV